MSGYDFNHNYCAIFKTIIDNDFFYYSILGTFYKMARIGNVVMFYTKLINVQAEVRLVLMINCKEYQMKFSINFNSCYTVYINSFSVSGERLSPYVSVCCGLMALSLLFF